MTFVPRTPRDDVNYARTSPVREAALLLGGVLGAFAAVALLLVIFVEALAPHVPVAWERHLPYAEPELSGSGSDPRHARLDALLERLAAHWPENPYPLRIGIAAEAQPNAFALPGGLVVVTEGLLDRVETENELAFVLAHELGHFRHRDHLRGVGRQLALSLLMYAVSGSARDFLGLVEHLALRSFDRRQESAADAFGLSLVYAEYGHVAAAADFLKRLPEPGPGLAGDMATYLSTHPRSRERRRELESLAAERGWPLEGAPSPL